jgi:archaellin
MNKHIILLLLILLTSGVIHAGNWIAVDGGSNGIDLNETKIENSLWTFLEAKKQYKFFPRKNYTYQYQANIKNGEEEVYINAFCEIQKRKDLHKYFIVVKDGGPCYFQIKYNPRTGKFYDLSVNGEA